MPLRSLSAARYSLTTYRGTSKAAKSLAGPFHRFLLHISLVTNLRGKMGDVKVHVLLTRPGVTVGPFQDRAPKSERNAGR